VGVCRVKGRGRGRGRGRARGWVAGWGWDEMEKGLLWLRFGIWGITEMGFVIDTLGSGRLGMGVLV